MLRLKKMMKDNDRWAGFEKFEFKKTSMIQNDMEAYIYDASFNNEFVVEYHDEF